MQVYAYYSKNLIFLYFSQNSFSNLTNKVGYALLGMMKDFIFQ